MDFKTLLESGDLSGKRVLVRVDWNVPLENGHVVDSFRIEQSLPTIEYLQKAGASIILISHLEPETASLRPVFECAKQFLPELTFEESSNLELLENLRNNPGEKDNARDFALSLASRADMFVNEAFSVSHREHASIVGIPKLLPSFAGLHFAEEVKHLSKAFYPKHPFLFILGGAKFDTKIPLIKKFINVADSLFVGGALAHNFFKEQGMNLGDSLVSKGDFELESVLASGKVLLPEDMLIKGGDGMGVGTITEVGKGDTILDAGPKTLETLKKKINESQFVLWNGPLGNYELGYASGTEGLAKLLAESQREVIVGGADTLACIKELDLYKNFSFISTGGGSMLDFLATGTLPGLEALKKI